MRVHAQQGDTVDAMCWRALGRTAGVVERVLASNPGLADLGVVLPHGTPVDLPDVVDVGPAPIRIVRLWD